MRRKISLVALFILLLTSCSPAQPSPTPTDAPTRTATVTPTVLPTATPDAPIATPESVEKFVPNEGSLTFLPGDENRLNGTLEFGSGAAQFYKEVIESILAGHAETHKTVKENEKDVRLVFSNDEFFAKNFGVGADDPEAFWKALKEKGYIVPAGLVLPMESEYDGEQMVMLRQAPEFKLDTVVMQILDDNAFVQKRLAFFDSDPANDEGSLDSDTFQMAHVYGKGQGYLFGVRFEKFDDGFNRMVLLVATSNTVPWDEIGGKRSPDPVAISHVARLMEFYPYLFGNMSNFNNNELSKLYNDTMEGKFMSLAKIFTNDPEISNGFVWGGKYSRLDPPSIELILVPSN